MSTDLPLDSMSVAEKLRVMETVWASLCSKPADVASPEWHATVLAERTRRLLSGEATISNWSDAKKRLQELGR
jgi:hypothetical protein